MHPVSLGPKSLVDLALIELRLSRICHFVVLGGPKEFGSKVRLHPRALHVFIWPNQLAQTRVTKFEEEV